MTRPARVAAIALAPALALTAWGLIDAAIRGHAPFRRRTR